MEFKSLYLFSVPPPIKTTIQTSILTHLTEDPALGQLEYFVL